MDELPLYRTQRNRTLGNLSAHTPTMARIETPEPLIPLPDPAPAALREWLADLPFANTTYCLSALLRALRTFNASPHLKPSVRFELADGLESCVTMLVERTEKPLLSTSMPQLPTVRSAELGTALYREMAVAYSLACPAKRLLGNLWQREELCQASHRSLRHWGLYLLGMAQLYKEPEAGFWPSIYRVYRQAEEFGVISRPVDDQDEPLACRTVRGAFKRILLFSLGGSGRFRPRDMRLVYGLLGTLADTVSVELRPPSEREPSRFYFNLDEGRPPAACPDGYDKISPTDRFFGTGEVVSTLMRDPLPVKGNHFGDAHNRHIQTVLAKSLCGGKSRKSSRVQANHECGLFIGLSEIIEALSLPGDGSAQHATMPLENISPIDWTKRSRFELMPVDSNDARHPRREDHLPRSGAFSEQIVMDEWSYLSEPAVLPPNPVSGFKGQAVNGALVNTSPHGYCVKIAGAGSIDLQIGVPVGIIEDGGSLFLGTVRWLKREEAGVRFGIKLLSPSAEVVEIRLSDGTSKGKGLLLPADRILRQDPELVVLPRIFRVNSELLIEGKRQPPHPYLGQICEQTLSFTRMTLVASRAKSAQSRS